MAEQGNRTRVLVFILIAAAGVGAGIWFLRSSKLSESFTVEDLTRSNTADIMGIKEQFRPPTKIIMAGRRFAKQVLQPLKDHVGYLTTRSWWRHPLTNVAVGGVAGSYHLTAEAADLQHRAGGVSRNDLLAKGILESGIPFDKMILEGGSLTRPKWIHLRRSKGSNERIIFRKDNNNVYTQMSAQQVLSLAA